LNDSPLQPITEAWLSKLRAAAERKKRDFGDAAAECWKFFTGPYADWMYKKRGEKAPGSSLDYDPDGDDEVPAPTFQITINKAAEVVQIFGPALYQRNPDRRVTPRRTYVPPPDLFSGMFPGAAADPMAMQAQQQFMASMSQAASTQHGTDLALASVMETYLNFTSVELDLYHESRLVVDEALIKGASVWLTEVVEMPSGLRLVGSFFTSIDKVLLDPDGERREDCMWVAVECIHPVWDVEREYNLAPGTIKGNLESQNSFAGSVANPDENLDRARGMTADLVRYYKIWSKMGIGGRLKDTMKKWPAYLDQLEQIGDNVYLAVADGVPFPLNLPPETLDGDDQAVADASQWPIPFWLDRGQWPITILAFHEAPGKLWPIAHLTPALGELKFINWVYSFLTGKIRTACRDILVLAKGLADEAKRAIKHGPDYSVLEISQLEGDIDKLVKFIQHPPFNPEIYKVLDHMMELFDKRTGLTDLVYGQTAQQLRSAEEANIKQSNASVRPDDMAQQVEAASSVVARKEMAAARWALTDQDVTPVLGTLGGWVWQQVVMQSDPASLFHQFECRVEQGSTKRPNREADVQNLNGAMTNLFAPLFQYAQQTGNVGPVNALMADWAKSIGLDADKYLLQQMPPPAPPGEPTPGESGQPQGAAA
jgi:hypothetical protein